MVLGQKEVTITYKYLSYISVTYVLIHAVSCGLDIKWILLLQIVELLQVTRDKSCSELHELYTPGRHISNS